MPACIVVLAGVNGAGKSSVAGNAILKNGGRFFNPDDMARQIRQNDPACPAAEANGLAWELGRRGLERALAEGGFFAFETTLGGNTITALLLDGAGQQAEIHLSYIGLDSVERHIERVSKRVAAGGHDIPEDTIRERYRTSRENLIKLIPHLSSLRVYDNSAETKSRPKPVLLLHMDKGTIKNHAPLERIPVWAKPLLTAAFRTNETRSGRRKK